MEATCQPSHVPSERAAFDVRGLVVRPLTLHVEHQDLDGHYTVTALPHGIARRAAHEIDHLRGILYTDRMRPDIKPIRVRQYPERQVTKPSAADP